MSMKPSEIRAKMEGKVLPVPSVGSAASSAAAAAAPVGHVRTSSTSLFSPAKGAATVAPGAAGGMGPRGPVRDTRALSAGSLAELWDGSFVDKDCIASVKGLLKVLTSDPPFGQAKFRKMLEFVINAIATSSLTEETRTAIAADADLATVFNGLYDIFVSALRGKVRGDTALSSDLAKLGFPPAYYADIVSVYTNRKDQLEAAVGSERVTLPCISNVSWRVDVTISTTTLSRVFQPSITLQMTLSDGRIRTFECSVKKFQELRYNIAKVYKDMMDVESHPTVIRAE